MVYYINLRARFVTGTNSSTNSTILFTGDKFGGNIYLKMEGKRFYHDDHLGTPQVLTDENGQIAWYGDYEPFGKVNILVERTTNNFRFPGQYYIEETGLYYNWWRWYESDVGRYYETDLVSQVLPLSKYSHINMSFNLLSSYHYSYNNSVRYIDFNGQIPVPSPGCLLACALCLGEKELKDKIKKYNCSEKCKDKCRVKSNEDYLKCMSLCMGNPLPDLVDLGFKVSCAICIGCLLLEFAPVVVAA